MTAPRVALVSSGLDERCGGIGVAAELLASALRRRASLAIWRHPHTWPRPARVAAVIAQSAGAAFRRPNLVLYEHVGLAQLHAAMPHLRGVRYAVFLHGVEVWEPVTGRRRDALARADLLLANSELTVRAAREVNPWLPPVHVTWLSVRAPPRSAPTRAREPLVIAVGRMNEGERRKGHDLILDAWPLIRAAVPDARLQLIGTGTAVARLHARVQKEALCGVELLGFVSNAQRDALYEAGRLFLLPSLQEGFGLAAVEAAAAAMPVLGVRGTVLEELFPRGRGLALAGAPTAESVAAAAIPILADPARAASLGREAQDRVREVFLREHFEARLGSALAPLLA